MSRYRVAISHLVSSSILASCPNFWIFDWLCLLFHRALNAKHRNTTLIWIIEGGINVDQAFFGDNSEGLLTNAGADLAFVYFASNMYYSVCLFQASTGISQLQIRMRVVGMKPMVPSSHPPIITLQSGHQVIRKLTNIITSIGTTKAKIVPSSVDSQQLWMYMRQCTYTASQWLTCIHRKLSVDTGIGWVLSSSRLLRDHTVLTPVWVHCGITFTFECQVTSCVDHTYRHSSMRWNRRKSQRWHFKCSHHGLKRASRRCGHGAAARMPFQPCMYL